jgi:hypothetical protein
MPRQGWSDTFVEPGPGARRTKRVGIIRMGRRPRTTCSKNLADIGDYITPAPCRENFRRFPGEAPQSKPGRRSRRGVDEDWFNEFGQVPTGWTYAAVVD